MNTTSSQYVHAKIILERFKVSITTLRRWDADGKMHTVRTPGGTRLYRFEHVTKLFHGDDKPVDVPTKTKICYARVSSQQQKAELERQIQDLRAAHPTHRIIHDIGSELNYNRRGFQALLELVHSASVDEVVVAHKDRLCRYGCELVDFLFRKAGTRLVVLGQDVGESDAAREVGDELLAVCNYFVAKRNGLRAAQNRRKRNWKGAGVFHPRAFGKTPIRAHCIFPDKLDYDCRLQRTRLDHYYRCVPCALDVGGEKQAPEWTCNEEGIVALDPGVRTFMTGYSPAGIAFEWGRNDISRIYRLCKSHADLNSRWFGPNVKHRRRYRMKRAARRIRLKFAI